MSARPEGIPLAFIFDATIGQIQGWTNQTGLVWVMKEDIEKRGKTIFKKKELRNQERIVFYCFFVCYSVLHTVFVRDRIEHMFWTWTYLKKLYMWQHENLDI